MSSCYFRATFLLEVEDEFLAADFLVNAVFEFVWLEGFILRASSLQLQKPRKTQARDLQWAAQILLLLGRDFSTWPRQAQVGPWSCLHYCSVPNGQRLRNLRSVIGLRGTFHSLWRAWFFACFRTLHREKARWTHILLSNEQGWPRCSLSSKIAVNNYSNDETVVKLTMIVGLHQNPHWE